ERLIFDLVVAITEQRQFKPRRRLELDLRLPTIGARRIGVIHRADQRWQRMLAVPVRQLVVRDGAIFLIESAAIRVALGIVVGALAIDTRQHDAEAIVRTKFAGPKPLDAAAPRRVLIIAAA